MVFRIVDKVRFIYAMIVVALCITVGVQTCIINNNEAYTERVEQNLKAATDELRITKTKDGKPEYDKLTYIVEDLKELKLMNAQLAEEVAKTKGQVLQIQKTEFKVYHDTVPLVVQGRLIDSTLHLDSKFDTTYSKGNYQSIATTNKYDLRTKIATGFIVKNEIGFTAVTGLKKTDLGYEIFVRPNYPNMVVTSLEGAIIDKNFFKKDRPKLVTVGLGIGFVPVSYSVIDRRLSVDPTRIGISGGINFNLSRILGK